MSDSSNNSSETQAGPHCSACGSWWRLPVLLALILLASLFFRSGGVRNDAADSVDPAANPPADAEATATDSVSLIIKLNNGFEPELTKVRWRPGMTIAELMNADRRTSFRTQGSGASAFVTSINGVANEGAGGHNWMYSVNGQRGDRSYAIYQLQPGDHVLWSFEPPQ